MNLRAVAAVSPQFLPYVRHRIDTDHIHAPVCQIKIIIHHLIKYPGILIIQIPLVGVKRSHNIMPAVLEPCKVTRRSRGKYLRYGLLIFRRYCRIGKEEIPAHVLPFPLTRSFRPFVILTGMVHYKIHTQIDPFFMAERSQLLQILHRSQIGTYLAEIRHRIPAVAAAGHRIQKGHQVEQVYPCLLYVRQFFPQSIQISGKIVNIHHHPRKGV